MEKKFFKNNRKRLINSIDEERCVIIVSSGYEKTKSADENYEFQVNTNFYYLTGIKQPEVHLIILKEKDEYQEILYIDEYDETYEKWLGHRLTISEASNICGIYKSNVDYKKHFNDDLKAILEDYDIVYLDLETNNNFNHNSFGLTMKSNVLTIKESLIVKDIYENIVTLRMSKQKEEIDAILSAIETTRIGIEQLMLNAKPDMYEYQLESYYDFAIKNDGNKPVSFKTIAAGGINATTLHYSSNNSILNDNELVLFDLGCKDHEYCSDISRTFPINGKFNELQKTIYNIVLKANLKIIRVAKAGMTLGELQSICIDTLAHECMKAKLIKEPKEIMNYYFHGVSHPIGLDTHDPFIRKHPLPVNAVISNEPGLYFPQYKIGVRIEDDLLLKKGKCINLSESIIKSVEDIENFMNKNK